MLKNQTPYLAICLAVACIAGCNEDDSGTTVSCKDTVCPAGSVCNDETGLCEAQTTDDKCKNVSCNDGETCNHQTGLCETTTPDDKCKNVNCNDGETCNHQTGLCETTPADKCANRTCNPGYACNLATGQCEVISQSGCSSDKDCKSDPNIYTYPEYCEVSTGICRNGACKGKTWDEEIQYCSITGKIVCNPGRCGVGGDVNCECEDNAVCNAQTKRCVTCELVEGNIVPNWSFEDWEGSLPANWSIVRNSYAQAGEVAKTNQADTCSTGLRLTSNSEKNARLESDAIPVPPITYIGGNIKYACTIKGFGNANQKLNFGYRTLDAEGKKLDENTTAATIEMTGSDSFQTSKEFELSIDPDANAFQILIGFGKGSGAEEDLDVTLDSFVCVPKSTVCDNVDCGEWGTCSVSSNLKDETGQIVGQCKPKEGHCIFKTDKNGEKKAEGCDAASSCDEATHTCIPQEGRCVAHTDCQDTTQKCGHNEAGESNYCVPGDRCEGVKCSVWQVCDAITGSCKTAEGKCLRSSDCTTQENPICRAEDNTCVAIDAVDSNGKPVNIVPNGSFEDWGEYAFGEMSVYNLPEAWFGTEYEIYPTHLVTEFDPQNVHEYTKSTHHGAKALQLVYTKEKQSKRFSSEGFDVPAGNYDCSYYVRGKGDIRIHSFSSAGDHPKSEFTSIDSLEWQRIPFSIRSGKDMRLVFYVGSTSEEKDHIQIDDVSCTKWQY